MQAPSSTWYQGLRVMMGNGIGHSLFWLIRIARIHLFEQGFSYPLLPLFQHCIHITISAAVFVWPAPGLCRDLCFLVIRADITVCRALVRATANQTWPQEMCEGTELDQLQRKTGGENNTFYAATSTGSVLRKQSLFLQSTIIWETLKKEKRKKKDGMAGDGA